MKILYIINQVTVGGAENQMSFLIKALYRKYPDMKITIISLMDPEPSMVADLKPYTEDIYNLGLRINGGVLNFTRSFRKLLKILKENKPDIVHSFLFHSNIMARFAKIFVDIPILFNATFDDAKGSPLRLGLIKYSDFLIDHFTIDNVKGCNNYTAKGIVKKSKMSYLSNGIQVEDLGKANTETLNLLKKQISYNEGDFIWLNIARLTEQKDHKNLLSAAAILKSHHPKFKIAIVGDGDLYEELNEEVKEKELDNNVYLLGRRNDINNLFPFAHAFVISSAWEGMPIVVMQAMNASLPILSTDVGALPILLEDKKSGLLVPKRDATALANEMLHVMRMTDGERNELGLQARLKIQTEFNIDNTVEDLMNLYLTKSKK